MMEKAKKPPHFKNKRGFKNNKPHFKPKVKQSTHETNEISNLQKAKDELVNVNPDEVQSFAKLPLSKKTLKGLKEEKFTVPTKVQRQSLIYSLRGLDVVAAAKTGSGKTLAFVIPLLELLFCNKWSKLDGLGALIITPTRELAYQIFEVLNKVGKCHDFSVGLVIGGKDLKYEWNRIHSCNIMVCTPGRLLQHMQENPEFDTANVQMLILDEADQCLSMGFADTMNCILEELPSERQTLLFSATQTRDVKDLVRAGCHNPIYCSVHEHSKSTTPKGLQENYVVCNAHDKFTFLWSFIRYHKKHKILIFLATCKQVKYMYDMFCKLHPGLSVMGLHGSMHQLRRMAIYDEFCRKKNAVLFATDVAARGLDIPAVDWVVQADCPEDVTTYIHRAGRTARYSHTGQAIILLTPSEEKAMLANLKAKNIPIEMLDVDPSKLHGVHVKVEVILSKYPSLKDEAVRAFKAYLKHVALMKDKKVFDVTSIDLDAFARSLGLAVTPRIRFLEKRLKQKSGQGNKKCLNEESQTEKRGSMEQKLTTLDFGADDSGDDDDDFLSTAVNQSLHVEPKEEDAFPAVSDEMQSKTKTKIVTKASVVKKILQKKLQVNTRILFDDEGELILDPTKQQVSSAAKEEDSKETGGINISKVMEIMKEEDRIDKKLHAEKLKEMNRLKKKKQKEKNKKKEEEKDEEEEEEEEYSDEESEDETTQAIIDDLPDPDKHYGSGGKSDDSEEESEEESTPDDGDNEVEESESEEEEVTVSGKRRAKDRAREAKRARLAQSNTLENLPVDEQEQLALFLLRGQR